MPKQSGFDTWSVSQSYEQYMGCWRRMVAQEFLNWLTPDAKQDVGDGRARFEVADAMHLPSDDASADVVTSALVVNFVPDRQNAPAEMRRVLRPGGRLAFYVWDYPGVAWGSSTNSGKPRQNWTPRRLR